MRSNGLPATDWAELGTVEPHLTDALLELLANEGIAAYAQPAAGPSVDWSATEYSAPMDVLFIARPELFRATPLVSGYREQAAWESLVARFDEPSDPDTTIGPVSVLSRPSDDAGASGWEEFDSPSTEPELPRFVTEEEHFTPPEPGPVRTDPIVRWAWIAFLGGPVVFLLALVLDIYVRGLLGVACAAAFIGGFLTLVSRLRSGDDEDDPEGGAVV